ncbi:Gfo/Idh/MocA family oxidoreductase [Candidatus Woesearchaeota archaeon]|nr:Gfo/Idh/MocA family oxidoreductase [Candidatus Woesearchaeota archaeon]
MRKYKIGVIGCGYWGPNLIRNFLQSPSVKQVACHDINAERLERMKVLFPSAETYSSYDKFMQSDVDAVAVATPVSFHYQIAKDALEHGKHVLIEKPITKTSKEALELIRLAEKNGKQLMVDHTYEYSPSVRKIRELVEKGELGNIFNISVVRVNLGLFQKDVDVIWDLVPHDISIFRFVLNKEPFSVRAFAESHILPGKYDTAYVLIKYPDNITAHLQISWLNPKKIREMTIIGNKKMLVYDDVNASEKIKIYDKSVDIGNNKEPIHTYYEKGGAFQFLYRSGDIHIPKLDEKEPLKGACDHFIDCIESGKKPLTDGYSGYKVMLVLEAIQESLNRNGDEVLLK